MISRRLLKKSRNIQWNLIRKIKVNKKRIIRMKSLIVVVSAFAVLGLTGCGTLKCCNKKSDKQVIKAVYTAKPVKMDGNLNEGAWAKAPVYNLALGGKVYDKLPEAMKKTVGKDLHEPGEFKLVWDEKYLYIGVKFADSDIYAYGEQDEEHHYSLGDVAEVFIKPENATYYWELYITPAAKKSTFFIPGRGCLMSKILTLDPISIKVASKAQGTINNWKDKDVCWTGEMAIPRKELEKYGAKFGPGCKWRIFLARYNYSRYLPVKELSSIPKQAETPNFHLLEEYGWLKLVK